MNAIEIYTSIELAVPPEAVWPFLVDWENLPQWMKEARNIEVLSEHREGTGVEARATISIGGIRTKDVVRVSQWDPPRTLELQHLGWVKGDGLMRCFPTPTGTHLYWRERLVPPWGVIGAMGIRVFKPLMKRTFAHDLQALKALTDELE